MDSIEVDSDAYGVPVGFIANARNVEVGSFGASDVRTSTKGGQIVEVFDDLVSDWDLGCLWQDSGPWEDYCRACKIRLLCVDCSGGRQRHDN